MFWLQVIVAVGIVAATVLVAAGRGDGLSPAQVERRRVRLPDDRPLAPADLDAIALGVGFRGYRMDEVDELIDRVAVELAERDERIAELTGRAGPGLPVADAAGRTRPSSGAEAGPSRRTGPATEPSAPDA